MNPLSAHRRTTVLLAAAGVCAAASASPAYAAIIDPSASGLSAVGPAPAAAHPAVDWTAGAPVFARSGPIAASGVHIAAASAAAGDGFAVASVTGLTYQQLSVSSVTATCVAGHTAVHITGTDNRRPLAAGDTVDLAGGVTVQVGATTAYPDGSTGVTGLRFFIPGPAGVETVDAADARC